MIRLIKKLLDDPHYPKETLEELQRDLKEMSPEKILKQAMGIIKEFCVRYEVLNGYAHIVVQFEKGRSTVIAPCVLSERYGVGEVKCFNSYCGFKEPITKI